MKRFLRRALRVFGKVGIVLDLTEAFITTIFQIDRAEDPKYKRSKGGKADEKKKAKARKKDASAAGQ